MRKVAIFIFFLGMMNSLYLVGSEPEIMATFPLEKEGLHLGRSVRPQAYFESSGRMATIMGKENGTSEIWVYPYKVAHNFRLFFLLEEENKLIEGGKIAERIDVYPHQTILRYVHSSFTVEEIFFAPLKERGIAVLLSVDTIKPLSIIVSFIPDLKPMWPAGLGGQYSYWHSEKNYFVISEGTGMNVALIGSPAGERFSTGPAHALPEEEMKLKIYCPPEESRSCFYPLFITASTEGMKKADSAYSRLKNELEELYREKFLYYRNLSQEHLSVKTPERTLNHAFEWAKVAVDKAYVCNPHLGCGLVAGYGLSGRSERPGFAWFFGGDTFFNSWALNSYGSFKIVRDALLLIRKNQRKDGKIMHELSQGAGFIPWFEKYPYGFYHAETTPYYIIALHDYILHSGDMKFLQESWPSVKKAYHYILTADTDEDGLMENTVAGLAALELGSFLRKTKTDIYLASLSVESYRTLAELASIMRERSIESDATKRCKKALKSLREKFYDIKTQRYVHAITVKDELLSETSVWPFMPLFFSHIEPDKAGATLDVFASSELSTDWGVRSLSARSEYYDPLNYNYGSVWPFLTGYTCLAEYNYNRTVAAFSHLMNLAYNTFIDALGYCPELFSGEFFKTIEASVPHQVFSSSPVITCLVRGLLGLKGNALKKEIEFNPSLPGGMDWVEVRNFRLGKDIFHFNLKRNEKKIVLEIKTEAESPYFLSFNPDLGFGAEVREVRVNGSRHEHKIGDSRGQVRCHLTFKTARETVVEIEYEKSINLALPSFFPQIGARSRGLRVVKTSYVDKKINITAEGIGGQAYELLMYTSRRIFASSGTDIEESEKGVKKLKISFKGNPQEYTRKNIVITFK